MKQELKVVEPKDFGLEKKQANELTKNLDLIIKERDILIDAYEDVITLEITEDNLKTFKELRLQIRDNRTKGIEKWHKENKAYFLQGGKFIDTIKRKEVEVNSRMEDKLLQAEKYFENLEKERLKNLQKERVELLSKFVEDASEKDLSKMDEDVWESYLATKKKKYFDKIEAEKKAEAERLKVERKKVLYDSRKLELMPYWDFLHIDHKSADFGELPEDSYVIILDEVQVLKQQHEAKQKAIQEENERLKAEAVKKENERKKEKEALENKLSIEKDKRRISAIKFLLENGFKATHGGHEATDYPHFIGALHYSEFDKDSELEAFKDGVLTYKSKVKQEAENKRLQAELKAKQEAELKEAKRLEELAKAPIKEQLHAWVNSFTFDGCPVENETTKKITNKFNGFLTWAKSEVNNI